MSRDKQTEIEEMAEILCRDYSMGECMVDSFDCLEGHCSKRERIEALYNAGYRKSQDVAEEIIGEVVSKAKAIFCPDCDYDVVDIRYALDWLGAELKKKYTEDKGRDKLAEFGKYSPLSWKYTESEKENGN